MVYRAVFCFLIALFCSSCATIVSKSTYPIAIKTVPSDAEFSIVDSQGRTVTSGKTPTTVYLKAGESFFRRGRYTVLFKREGYEDDIFPLHARLDGWYFGNIVFGGLIGMLVVDPATGAMYALDTSLISVALRKKEAVSQLEIRTLDQLPTHLHPFLVPLESGEVEP